MNTERPPRQLVPTRRTVLRLAGLGLSAVVLAECQEQDKWHSTDLTGSLPRLALTMTRASDGKTVTAANYRNKITLLYFGYTFCPDVCPTTLLNLTQALKRLGPAADRVRVLFVTVDPSRDSLKVLREYADAFAPQMVGLRGSDDQIAALAKRYRVAYSVTPESPGHPYEVTHSSAVYVFDGNGDIRQLLSGLSLPTADLDGATADLKRLTEPSNKPGFISRLLNMV